MFIRLTCCRLSRHRTLIFSTVFVSLLLLFVHAVVAPVVLEFLQRPFARTSEHVRQHVVASDNPIDATDSQCTFFNCFNIYRCDHRFNGGFKVYVYPMVKYVDPDGIPIGGKVSKEYHSMLSAIVDSEYYTGNPEEACVFVPSIDTLNQNRFRVKETSQALALLPQ